MMGVAKMPVLVIHVYEDVDVSDDLLCVVDAVECVDDVDFYFVLTYSANVL